MNTMKRIYDPGNKWIDAVIKEYTHWVVEVGFRQHTLGSFVIFAKRDVEHFSDLFSAELEELPTVMKEMEHALAQNNHFKPDRMNYLQLGNKLHHLHFHAIARYEKPREFNGKEWVDSSFGKPPIFKTEAEEVSMDEMRVIKKEMMRYL